MALAFGWNQNTLTALNMGIVMLGTLIKPPLGLTAFYVEVVILILPPLQTTLTAFYVEIVMLSPL